MTPYMRKTIGWRAGLLVAGLLSLPSPTLAAIRYVKHNAAGANNGTSWTDAYASLQTALTAAVSGDELWVAAGTYKPDGGSGDRTASFRMKNGVGIYGGLGTETLQTQRNYAANLTYLSGEINNQSLLTDNSYHVVLALSLDPTAIPDAFIVTSGYAVDAPAFPDPGPAGGGVLFSGGGILRNLTIENCRAKAGGGMYVRSGQNPTFDNLLFQNNRTVGVASHSGGFATDQSGTVTMNNCRFIGNVAESGDVGGANIGFGSSAVLTDCLFENNSASGDSGGLSCFNGAVQAARVVFRGNSSGAFGGGVRLTNEQAQFTDCTFEGNSATQDAGALLVSGGSTATVDRCSFTRNTAALSGGAIRVAAAALTMRNSRVLGNTAASLAGGIVADNNSTVEVQNSSLVGNRADLYAAMFIHGGTFSIVNTTITRNVATNIVGGLYFEASPVGSMVNSILWLNAGFGGANTSGLQQVNHAPGTPFPSLSYSVITGATGPTIYAVDPQFFVPPSPGGDGTWGTSDDNYGDLRLQCTSPACDAGNNAALTAEMTFDLAGNLRRADNPNVNDTGPGMFPYVDIGAYEHVGGGPCVTCMFADACAQVTGELCTSLQGRNPDGTLSCSSPMVYLDWMSAQGGNGSYLTPFQILLQAEVFAPTGAVVRILRSGNYPANIAMDKPLKIINQSSGPAILGGP